MEQMHRQPETQTSAAGVALAQYIKEDPPIWGVGRLPNAFVLVLQALAAHGACVERTCLPGLAGSAEKMLECVHLGGSVMRFLMPVNLLAASTCKSAAASWQANVDVSLK